MSNILTSYLRIYPKNKQPISRKLQQYLLNNIVRSYNQFGSYWVRIELQWNELENALDLQFGSTKSYDTAEYILDKSELHLDYYIWERRANESGFPDQILQYFINEQDNLVDATCENCKYGFDRVNIIGVDAEKYFSEFNISRTNNSIELLTKGTYFSINDRSFQDLKKDTEYYGSCLGYDSAYNAPQFCNQGNNTNIQPPELAKVLEKLENNQISSHEIESIELLWKSKIVSKQQWNINDLGYEDWLIYSSDNWDNCLDENFLKFRQEYHSKYE